MKLKLLLCALSILLFVGHAANAKRKPRSKTIVEQGVVINGVSWATCNVDKPGTFAAKPEDPGMFYQWNIRIGWSSTEPKKAFDGRDPKITWHSGNRWRKENDPCPEGWEMPDYVEFKKLCDKDKVRMEWIPAKGKTLAGRKFTDRTSGNSIFLPAAGSRSETSGSLHVEYGFGEYWSETSETHHKDRAYYLNIGNGMDMHPVGLSRSSIYEGKTVRCVSK